MMSSFVENFNITNPRYLEMLLSKYPTLTQKEILLCMYLKLNHSSADISEFMKVSKGSIDTYRYNLRKKFRLNKNQSLVGHLNTLQN